MTASTAVKRSVTVDRSHLRDDQLEVLRGLLLEALAEQRHQYQHNDAIVHELVDGNGDDDVGHDREFARVAADRARDAADDIEGALRRLAVGAYGTCESCGRAIPFERLEAIPQARYCVACPRASGALR